VSGSGSLGGTPELFRLHGLQVAMRVQGKGDPLLLINGMTRPLQSWDNNKNGDEGKVEDLWQ